MQILRITGWDTTYENNRTRSLRDLSWVPIPNQMDGDGYTELLDHPDGPAHYAAWMAIILVASKCTPRGNLIRDNGLPHDSESLSRISRIEKSIFDAAIPRLVAVGWLTTSKYRARKQQITEVHSAHLPADQEGATPQEGAPSRAREKERKKEWNGIEGKEETSPTLSPPDGGGSFALLPAPAERVLGWREAKFEEFWRVVWWRVGRDAALKAWRRKVTSAALADILIAAAVKQGPGLLAAAARENRSAVHPATWINQGRWMDEESPVKPMALLTAAEQRDAETRRLLEEQIGGGNA